LPLLIGDLDLYLVHGSLDPKFTTQTAPRSLKRFWQNSRSWQTDRPTDRPRYSERNNRPHLRT